MNVITAGRPPVKVLCLLDWSERNGYGDAFPKGGNMRKNKALRDVMIAATVANGGIANTAQMRGAAEQAGITNGLRYLDRYAQTLADEGVLRRLGKGVYANAEMLDAGTLGIFGLIPYGTHLYG